MPTSSKFHITQSLLHAWMYGLESEDGYESFVKALNRQKEPPTQAMLDGQQFENCVNAYLNGNPISPDHKWSKVVTELGDYLNGSQQQVNLRRDIIVDGVCFELQGILDFLRGGIIFDTKFSGNYYLNKYLNSPQHSAYFYLVPEAREFQYLISDGSFIYMEKFAPEMTTPIDVIIRQFMRWMDRANLVDVYAENWECNNYYKGVNK